MALTGLGRSAMAALLAAALVAPLEADADPITFVALGDMPYNLPEDNYRFARLIDAINHAKPAFSVHVGDIKGGGSPCTDAAFRKIYNDFARFEAPLIYTPGDNEWTDCYRKSAGRYDPLERLAALRKLFFPDGNSLGKIKLPMKLQSDDPNYAEFVENRRWSMDGVLFATLHVVGSNNNLGRDNRMDEEFRSRNRATRAWLDDTYAEAVRSGAKVLVLFMQADPLLEYPFPVRTGFNDLIAALELHAGAWRKPTLLVHGDTHQFYVDRPLRPVGESERLLGFVRLEVPGASTVEAVRVTIDPDLPQPFRFALVLEDRPVDFPGDPR